MQTYHSRRGLHPFRLVDEADGLYGGGTADSKGRHLINIAALQAIIDARGALGFDSSFLIEMGEKMGSFGLSEFCAVNKDARAADVFTASDGPRLQSETPTMFMDARGGISFELTVKRPKGAHDSGN